MLLNSRTVLQLSLYTSKMLLLFIVLSMRSAAFPAERGIQVAPSIRYSERVLYKHDWAIIVGINSYRNLPHLAYAVNDARAYAEALKQIGVAPDHMFILTDELATKRAIESILADRLKQMSGVDDRVFFFFAGHGVTQKSNAGEEGFIMPVDADERQIYSTAISMRGLRDIAMRLPAKHIFLAIDSCYSGYAVTRGSISSELVQAFTEQRTVQVLTAGQRGQPVVEDGGHGIFTKFLLDGFQGAADINKDGILTALELGQWTQSRVVRASEKKQVPMFGTLDGEGQFVVRWDLESKTEQASLPHDPWRGNAISVKEGPDTGVREPTREVNLGELYAAAGAPRLGLSIEEMVDGQQTKRREVQQILESDLRRQGIRVFATDVKKEPESQSLQNGISRAEPIADLVLSGTSATDFDRTISIEGISFHFYRPSITLRLVRTTTKEILASMSMGLDEDIDVSAMSKEEARRRSLQEIGKRASTGLLERLTAYWAQTTSSGDLFDVVITKGPRAGMSTFESFLRGDGRIRALKRRQLHDISSRYEIQFSGSQYALIELLLAYKDRPRLLEEVDHQITIEFTDT